MIIIVSILALLSVCNGDVSHLDTDLREDGYHYKQPSQPFPPDNNGLDNQLSPDVSQPRPRPRTQPKRPVPSKPTAEYLPPDEFQQASQPSPFPKFQTQPPARAPARDYGPPSTFLPQTPAEPTKDYGTPTTLIPQTPQPAFPQKPTGKAHQEYGPPPAPLPRTPKTQPRPSTGSPFSPRPVPKQPRIPSTPEREYLPPGDNEINAESKPNGAFPGPGPTSSSSYPTSKFPAQQPTLPAPESTIAESYETPTPTGSVFPSSYQTTKPKYAGPEPTIQEPQSTYPAPESTYPAPQSTYPAPQPTYGDDSGLQPTAPDAEPEPAHELGPDGYKYKVPTNKFKY